MRALLLLGVLLVAPCIRAAEEAVDPARDVMVTRGGLMTPVDSIDLVSFAFDEGGGTIQVADLGRRGLEDRLFVQSAHAYRAYGSVLSSAEAMLILVSVWIDEEPVPRGGAFELRAGSLIQLPTDFVFEPARGSLAWRLHEPRATVESATRATFAALYGCDGDEACQPGLVGLSALDVAPNEQAGALAEITPPVWWNDVFGEDDGQVPRVPLSLASIWPSG